MRAIRKSDGKLVDVTSFTDFVEVTLYQDDNMVYEASELDFDVEDGAKDPRKWYCGRTVCCNNGASDYLQHSQCDKALCPRRIPYPYRDI